MVEDLDQRSPSRSSESGVRRCNDAWILWDETPTRTRMLDGELDDVDEL